MATDLHLTGLSSSVPGALDLTMEFDRVLHTAADRPDKDTLPALPDPAADHGDAELKARRDDVEEKHQRIRDYLDETGHDAVVLGMADSVAWFTSGGDLGQDLGCGPASILLFVNRTCRAVIADNVQSSRVFEEELAGLGFQLKERPWYDDPFQVVAELCHNKRVATDMGGYGCSQVAARGRCPACPAATADPAGAAAAPRAGPHPDPGRRGDLPQLRPGRARGRRRRPPGSPPDPRGGRPGGPPRRRRRPAGPVPPAQLQGIAHLAAGHDRRHRPPPWACAPR